MARFTNYLGDKLWKVLNFKITINDNPQEGNFVTAPDGCSNYSVAYCSYEAYGFVSWVGDALSLALSWVICRYALKWNSTHVSVTSLRGCCGRFSKVGILQGVLNTLEPIEYQPSIIWLRDARSTAAIPTFTSAHETLPYWFGRFLFSSIEEEIHSQQGLGSLCGRSTYSCAFYQWKPKVSPLTWQRANDNENARQGGLRVCRGLNIGQMEIDQLLTCEMYVVWAGTRPNGNKVEPSCRQ